jgi:hypothetical protein
LNRCKMYYVKPESVSIYNNLLFLEVETRISNMIRAA